MRNGTRSFNVGSGPVGGVTLLAGRKLGAVIVMHRVTAIGCTVA